MSDSRKLSPVSLHTPRLLLREFLPTDAEAIQAYASDPEVARYTSWGPNTPVDTAAVLAFWLEQQFSPARKDFTLAIVRRAEGDVIGGAGFGAADFALGSANFGYVLRRDAWGCGYATEAARAVRDWAFAHAGIVRLVAHCEAANVASSAVLAKLGFLRGDPVRLARLSGEVRLYETFIAVR